MLRIRLSMDPGLLMLIMLRVSTAINILFSLGFNLI